MDLGLRGRTALVFGGSKGLGRASAAALAAEGVQVAIVARGAEALEAAAGELAAQHGVPVQGFVADVADHAAALAAVDAAVARFGAIDILVNNTGGPPPSGVLGIDPAIWSAQFQAMVLSVIRITDHVVPGMRQRGWGRVITIASATVVEPNPVLGLSNALRSTLVGWSKTLAGEVAKDGITVNMLLPGLVATDRTAALDASAAARSGGTVEDARTARAAAIPVGRYGTPAEFGAVAAFLASAQASYVTGSMLRVDGGMLRSV